MLTMMCSSFNIDKR